VVLDTSAVLAILFGESEAPALLRAIAADPERLLGAPSLVEASAVMVARKGAGGGIALDALLERLGVRVIPMSEAAARLGRLAYSRFGKGIGEPAVLNFGDCLAYGVAMTERQPLLFKGEGFSLTDIVAVPW
jgi:ribonuclease VapC